jgi:transcriptional regulator with XRE-family HTH domain
MNTEPRTKRAPGRRRPEDIDRYVGARTRERRMMLGLRQQQLAELIGVSFQQVYKYEQGTNRISAGRLYQIAQALDTDVRYFFDGIGGNGPFRPTQQQRLLLELVRNFMAIQHRRHQQEIVSLVRALAEPAQL